ncbi:MAG TPA: hypothetical protein VGN20_29090 [Mucilaginibacter sp.]|jgi:hypothetical protein
MSAKKKNLKIPYAGTPGDIKAQNAKPKPANKSIPQKSGAATRSPALINNNSKSQTEEMEVHHHPDIHHKEKKWKEYLLEGLMIFIAVTMGYFAESIRERIGDKSKEQEYIESLVQDLKADQRILSQNIFVLKSGILMMDTMINVLDHPANIQANTGQLYFLGRLAPRLQPLAINDKTYEQLKSTGNFRLIKNITISNKITDYYKKIPLVRLLETINESEFTQYKSVAAKIFNPEIFIGTEGVGDDIKRLNGNPPLRTTNNELLQELSIYAVYMHGTKKGILGADEGIRQAGAELISYLQKEYKLEED